MTNKKPQRKLTFARVVLYIAMMWFALGLLNLLVLIKIW